MPINVGSDFQDFLIGTDLDDALFGLGGPDAILALRGDDYVSGGSGQDHLAGGRGNDVVDGGQGFDIAYFRGDQNDYTITHLGGGVVEVTRPVGFFEFETDVLVNVEAARFLDGNPFGVFAVAGGDPNVSDTLNLSSLGVVTENMNDPLAETFLADHSFDATFMAQDPDASVDTGPTEPAQTDTGLMFL